MAALRKYEAEQLPGRLAELEKSWTRNPQRHSWAIVDVINSSGPKLTSLVHWYRTRDPQWLKFVRQVQLHLRSAPKPKIAKILVASEGLPPIRLHTQGDDFFKETYFLRRGDPDQKEGLAHQGFLQTLMTGTRSESRWQEPPPKEWRTSYRRRALANWICEVEHGGGASWHGSSSTDSGSTTSAAVSSPLRASSAAGASGHRTPSFSTG